MTDWRGGAAIDEAPTNPASRGAKGPDAPKRSPVASPYSADCASAEVAGLPSVSLWELPAFYRRLKASIMELENAWEDGRLPAALADEDVTNHLSRAVTRSYERLISVDDLRHSSFRRDSIHAVLNPVKELLSPPRIWFEVAPLLDRPHPLPSNTLVDLPWPGAPMEATEQSARIDDLVYRVAGPTGELQMPLQQMVNARFWGIGFELENRHDEQVFVATLLREVLDRLAVDLNDLLHIQRWYRSRPRDGHQPVIVPEPSGRRYEQLMLDVLNEEFRTARRARLAEDFLEKTDVRARVKGVLRRRGARVQITQTTHPDYLAQKRAAIRRANEYVILSPLPLAQAMLDPRIGGWLSLADRAALWRALPENPATVAELAQSIKRIFLSAMDGPMDHPYGPMVRVPRPIRALLRTFVCAEAHRTTSEMRARHANHDRNDAGPAE